MCPLRLIPKIFLFDEEELSAELRAQRTLNKARIPEMARYVVTNPKDYVFSSITASIDGRVAFEASGDKGTFRTIGKLTVPMTARFIINDGQHRRAAIEQALQERPELNDETISVVFFIDAGLKRSQQMFADLNRHAMRPTQSIGILYDHRDNLAQLARFLVDHVPIFQKLTEMEKTTISNRSHKLFTLSSVYLATQRLLRKQKHDQVSEKERGLAQDYWTELATNMPDWQAALKKSISTAELRRDYIHAHGVALQALAIVGSDLITVEPTKWRVRLRPVQKIDWSRKSTAIWEGRAMANGRISKAQTAVQLTANCIKQSLGLSLSPKERQLEEQHGRSASRNS